MEKAFNIINTDVDKFIKAWELIFSSIVQVTLKQAHQQIVLFCIHSVKENFVASKKVKDY